MIVRGVKRAVTSACIPAGLLLLSTTCQNPAAGNALSDLACSIPSAFVADGGPGKDGIPALTNPTFVAPDHPSLGYLRDQDRVIGVQVGTEYMAVPINILWWHEIVNLNRGTVRLAITHCPLTGSSLVFDRSSVDGVEFGVSGLLFMNNLMMYDRTTPSSLWPQMSRGARCGNRDGTPLPLFPSVEMAWVGWRSLHPTTTVVSGATGLPRDYAAYPYGDYDVESNPQLLSPVPRLDTRRAPKERVLGIVRGNASLALPFGALRAMGDVAAVHVTVGGAPTVVFWDAARASAAAFDPVVNGTPVAFRITAGEIIDDRSGSRWSADGRALTGPLAGEQLSHSKDSFIAYWFAWAVFYPQTLLWSTG
ncbi:MAG: DUF3179 domain-containing protein [Gemmatimonadaceae bacterium]